MDLITSNHLERLKNQTLDKFTLDKIPEWIESHTRILGDNFSFKGHEYQQKILADQSQEVVCIKSSQMGITEISIRMALALCAVMPHYTVIYTLPTATFASNVMSTRVDPVINDSQFLKDLVSTQINNNEIKKIGDSFMYMKGSASGNAPISIPADHLVHDELDFSDQDILDQYQSRLTHSKFKRKHKFSTPTLPHYGIHQAFMESRRHYELLKCNHCNHTFLPDFYDHVKVPDWDFGLEEITKNNMHLTRWKEAKLLCPHCGKEPDTHIDNREWVLENPNDNYVAAGYNLSPFSAPAFITPASLILSSTRYTRRSQFVNFALGKPMADSESSITLDTLNNVIVPRSEHPKGMYVMGIDVGSTSYFTVMLVTYDNLHVIVHTEAVGMGQLTERKRELQIKYRPRVTVIDALPYTDTVLKMQYIDSNLYAAFYKDTKTLELHTVVSKEQNKEKGRMELKQVDINRNKAFDVLMDDLRDGLIIKMSDANDEVWKAHMQDMKRVQKFTRTNELEYVWEKTKNGDDHFHHSLLYAETAARMVGVSDNQIVIPSYVGSFKVKPKKRSNSYLG